MVSRWTSVYPSIRISFPDDNLSKHQWIFTKLGMCIDIVEIWFWIANRQSSSTFDGVICPRHVQNFRFRTITSNCQGILTKLDTCIDIKEVWFGIANGQILSIFDRVICPRHDNGGVLSFYVFFIYTYIVILNLLARLITGTLFYTKLCQKRV